jgi:hypothetical protein
MYTTHPSAFRFSFPFALLLVGACSTYRPTPAPPTPAQPIDGSGLRRQALAAYERKDFATCVQLFNQAAGLPDPTRMPGEDLYSSACCRARAGELAAAEQDLGKAISLGFRDVPQLDRDEDLVTLRTRPAWREITAAAAAKRAAFVADQNAELLALYEADQGDRMAGDPTKIDWTQVGPRDEARRKRVSEILAAGGARVSYDYLHAAMVFQHGDTAEEIKRAHDLAKRAVELDAGNGMARWLMAAAWDRYLQRTGRPQIYGTQFQRVNGHWTLEPIDVHAVDDAERVRLGVPPLAEQQKRAEEMNRKP